MNDYHISDIFAFLADIATHNERPWFAAHRGRYEAASAAFAAIATDLKSRIARFDPTVAGINVKDTLYRIYRDTRFSPDKSPYKRHFGTYINAQGKKSLHGGYYFHIQPDGNSCLAVGTYQLPAPVLRAVRWSVVGEEARFHAILTEPHLAALAPCLGDSHLKTLPAGFPRDFAHPEYLRPRDYTLFVDLPDSFFNKASWIDDVAERFRLMKPFLDFVNETVDDYI